MDYYFDKNDKAIVIQCGVLIFLNSLLLVIFNWGKSSIDTRGICTATISVTIPLLFYFYKEDNKLVIIKKNFNSIIKKLLYSVGGLFLIILGKSMFVGLTLSPIPAIPVVEFLIKIVYTFFLILAYFVSISALSIFLYPWLFTLVFWLDKKINTGNIKL